MEKFVVQFNRFAAKKSAQLASWRQEASALFHLSCRLRDGKVSADAAMLRDPARFQLVRRHLQCHGQLDAALAGENETSVKPGKVAGLGASISSSADNLQGKNVVSTTQSTAAVADVEALTLDDVSSVPRPQLEQKIADLQQYINGGFKKQVEQEVFADLSSHSTVAYVKSLEAQKKQVQDKLREEVQRHKALRIAHRAQSRSLEKLMGKIKGKNRI